jgi:hypothetical protein
MATVSDYRQDWTGFLPPDQPRYIVAAHLRMKVLTTLLDCPPVIRLIEHFITDYN